jgi:hypothetical protein
VSFPTASFMKKMACLKGKLLLCVCNLLCIIDEVFLFTQVNVIKKVSYMLVLYAEDIIRLNVKSNCAG